MRTAVAAAAIPALLAASPAAASQIAIARCTVRSGTETFIGPCTLLTLDGRGSFEVGPNRGRYFTSGTRALEVTILPGGAVANVRAYHGAGLSSRWGLALRSAREPDCWEAPSFSVCAYIGSR